MLKVFQRKQATSARTEPDVTEGGTHAAGASAGQPIDARAIVQSLQKETSGLGREAAEVRGVIDDTIQGAMRQQQAVSSMATHLQGILQSQASIAEVTEQSLAGVGRARSAVADVAREVAGIVDTLREVANAAQQITQIAMQTRLVAFNASVEAKRAGEAGRGFGVVADAVKDLAARVEASSKDIMGTVGNLDSRIESLSREIRSDADQARRGAFHQALAEVEGGVGRIAQAARHSQDVSQGMSSDMGLIERETHQATAALRDAMSRSESFLKVSEHLMEVIAACGIETEDTPYIRAATQAAEQLGKLLNDAVRTGTITAADLFDENYRPLAGTNPPQHETRYIHLADRLFPQVQEKLLELSPKVVYCIAVDRNGYVPTHNRKYCHPQRPGDTVWNTANSRYRRIFNDRTGLASARNRRPFLLQTYRRDMGGGKFVLMKEATAPIMVDGRHWGAVRLAYQF